MKPVIICVDDENLILDSLKMLLKEHFGNGYSIEITENGNDALDLIEELIGKGARIPILISDYIMPGKKGDELLIQAHSKIPETFKILLTGQADLQGVENIVNKASLYRFLNKPWTTEDFVLTIAEALKSFEQITKERIHNTELEISEKKYKEPVENSLDIIFSLDKEDRITSINQSIERILKYKPKNVLGKKFLDLIYKSDSINEKIVLENMLELVNSKDTVSFICDLVNESGEPIEMVIKLKYTPVDDEFTVFGTASNVKEDLLLQLCETETQVYRIGNSITQIDMVCKRLSEAITKYSNVENVLAMKLCIRELLIVSCSKNKKLIIEYALDPTKVEIRITDEENDFDHKNQIVLQKEDNRLYALINSEGLTIAKRFFDICELKEKDNSLFLAKNFTLERETLGGKN